MTKPGKPYLVLARKYRPAAFDAVIGQEAIAATLKNAITSGRIAQAFLFAGPRGIGKTSMARILAKALNCLSAKAPTTEPCGTCEACEAIARGGDLDAVEFDAASNRKVEEIQSLILDRVGYAPARCRFKVFIVDEVQQLSPHAFDALLKTLEEPPAHVRFIFATTHPGDVPPTIHSRCQRYDFRRVGPERLQTHLSEVCLQEGVQVPAEVLALVARTAGGSVRDALSILEQAVALGAKTAEEASALVGVPPDTSFSALLDAALARDVGAGLGVIAEAWGRGWDLREYAEGFLAHLRDHLAAAAGVREPRADVLARAKRLPTERWIALLERAAAGLSAVRQGLAGRAALDLLFLGILSEPAPLAAASSLPAAFAADPAPAIPAPPAAPPPQVPAMEPGRTAVDWQAVIEKVGQKRMSLAAMLRGTSLLGTEGAEAVVQLPPDGTASYLERLNEPEKRGWVEEALSAACGRPQRVRYVLVEAPHVSAGPEPPGADDPVVRMAERLLGGRVVRRPPPS